MLKTSLAVIFGALISTGAMAVPDQPSQWEKCAGVSKAGKTKCGSLDGSHKCGGQAKFDNLDTEWIYVPKGTCDRITGGKVVKVVPAK